VDVDGSSIQAESPFNVGWLGLKVGGRPALSLHSLNELRVNCCSDCTTLIAL